MVGGLAYSHPTHPSQPPTHPSHHYYHPLLSLSPGLEPVVVENVLDGEELRTNIDGIEKHIHDLGAENVACVLTTTSCFAPRAIDRSGSTNTCIQYRTYS